MKLSIYEKKAFQQGHRFIAGIDEAGRGPLAGPVAAAAVLIDKNNLPQLRSFAIKDSKQLTAKQREQAYDLITNNPNIQWSVSFVSSKIIDKINILEATRLAWQRCLFKLSKQPNYIFIDGQHGLFRSLAPNHLGAKLLSQAVVKGDEKIAVVAMASIMAKVSRDRLMAKMHKKYPQYGFCKHMGYGTKQHVAQLTKHGICDIHRKSYGPVFDNLVFSDKVYCVVSKIPRGRTMTYQEVAQAIGHPKSYRAVGNALNKNPYSPNIVPCHRVIRLDGTIGGYAGGKENKILRLIKEKAI